LQTHLIINPDGFAVPVTGGVMGCVIVDEFNGVGVGEDDGAGVIDCAAVNVVVDVVMFSDAFAPSIPNVAKAISIREIIIFLVVDSIISMFLAFSRDIEST
jgi:hypothetical protein